MFITEKYAIVKVGKQRKTASSNKKYAKFYSLDFSDKIPQNVKYNNEYD
jgi:hypothetical protein